MANTKQIRYQVVKGDPDRTELESTIEKAIEFLRKPLYVALKVGSDRREYHQFSNDSRDSFATLVEYCQSGRASSLFRLNCNAAGANSLHEEREWRGYWLEARQYSEGMLVLLDYAQPKEPGIVAEFQQYDRWQALVWIPTAALTPITTYPAFTLASTEPAIA